MKLISLLFLFSISTHALENYAIQFGYGTESCHPNTDGLKQCVGFSPDTKEILIPLVVEPEQTAAYGYYSKSGEFEKIGFEISVKIAHFLNLKTDDMLTLKIKTWSLAKPEQKYETLVETFTRGPENLGRLNLEGYSIGTEDDFSKVILSVRKSKLLKKR